jgi:hypothetical protein
MTNIIHFVCRLARHAAVEEVDLLAPRSASKIEEEEEEVEETKTTGTEELKQKNEMIVELNVTPKEQSAGVQLYTLPSAPAKDQRLAGSKDTRKLFDFDDEEDDDDLFNFATSKTPSSAANKEGTKATSKLFESNSEDDDEDFLSSFLSKNK